MAVDFPPDPKRIANDAVARRPVRCLQWHEYFAALRETGEYPIRFFGVRNVNHHRKSARCFGRREIATSDVQSTSTETCEPHLFVPVVGQL